MASLGGVAAVLDVPELGMDPGIPGNGNMGKWFDMRFDMDMVDGGRGIPLDWPDLGNMWLAGTE